MPRLSDDTRHSFSRTLSNPSASPSTTFRRVSSSSPPTSTFHARLSSLLSSVRRFLPSPLHGLYDRVSDLLLSLSILQLTLLAIAGLVLFILGILFLAFNRKIFAALTPLVEKWRHSRTGWMVLWGLVVLVSFPPLIGYSTCFTLAGFVFGVWKGYLIVASATIVGSTLSFLVSRYFLRGFVERLMARDKRFEALALTLRHDGLKLLIMIRLCPLPYSLSNGAISTFPTITPLQFALANLIASPKLLIGLFIGSQLGGLAEDGAKMNTRTKIVSWISIIMGICIAVGTGWFMYVQTQARAKELEALEGQQQRGSSRTRRDDPEAGAFADEDDEEGDGFNYEDDPTGREAARQGDGISLHTTAAEDEYADDDAHGDADYRDEWADDGEEDGGLDAVFQAGDGEEDSEVESPTFKDGKRGRR